MNTAIQFLGCVRSVITAFGKTWRNPSKSKIAEFLFNHEQYDLSTKLYEQSDKGEGLGFNDLLFYGSAVSNANPDMQGAATGT